MVLLTLLYNQIKDFKTIFVHFNHKFSKNYMINGNIRSYKRSRVEIIDLICHLK